MAAPKSIVQRRQMTNNDRKYWSPIFVIRRSFASPKVGSGQNFRIPILVLIVDGRSVADWPAHVTKSISWWFVKSCRLRKRLGIEITFRSPFIRHHKFDFRRGEEVESKLRNRISAMISNVKRRLHSWNIENRCAHEARISLNSAQGGHLKGVWKMIGVSIFTLKTRGCESFLMWLLFLNFESWG